jgi:hypothetical protein
MNTKHLSLVLLLVLVGFSFFACTLPPYSEELSLAELTAKKMDRILSVGPLYTNDEDIDDCHFIPDRTLSPSGGFFLTESDRIECCYAAYDTTYRTWSTYSSGTEIDVPSGGEKNFRYLVYGLKPYAALNTWAAVYPFSSGSSDTLYRLYYTGSFMYDGTTSPISSITGALGVTFNNVVGVSVSPQANDTTDTFTVLGKSGSSYYEIMFSTFDSAGISGPSDLNTTVRMVSSPVSLSIGSATNGFYSFDSSTLKSFLSVYDDTALSYTNYSWYESGGSIVTKQLPFTGRIQTILSSGDLYVVSGNTAEIRDQNGTKKLSFPTGKLRFVHEVYDTTNLIYYMYFTKWYSMSQNGSTGIYFDIYRVATNDLEKLE